MSKARSYCFTLNNYTADDLELIKQLKYKFIIIGDEVGESGTPHLQGYVSFNSSTSFKTVKDAMPKAHIEASKGTPQQNISYCSKQNVLFRDGEEPKMGKRTDLDDIREVIQNGGGMKDVVSIATSYQSVKMAEAILKYTESSRKWKPKVLWFHGKTGTGKTKTAYEILGENCYTCMGTGKWFEGYDAHENVLVDDMRGDFMKFHDLLRFLDRNEFRVETKGGSRQFLAKNIIITSCHHPDKLFDTREDIKQLIRRIDEIREF